MSASGASSRSSCAHRQAAGPTTDDQRARAERLMPGRDTGARRYAEAAFEAALRDNTVAAWRRELDAAAEICADPNVTRALGNPAVPPEEPWPPAQKILGRVAGKPVL